MVELNTVLKRLAALRQYQTELERYRPLTFEKYIASSSNYWAVERGLQLAAQAMLDVGAHILAADFAVHPQEYRDVFVELGRVGVLPQEFAESIADLAGFRNILVHEYLRIDPQRVYDALQNNLSDLKIFGQCIVEYLRRSGAIEDEDYITEQGGYDHVPRR